MRPFVKWAGGKRQILNNIIEIIHNFADENFGNYTYIEPFVGGGAVFLNLEHDKAIINDNNKELMNAYLAIKENPKELMEKLDEYKECYMEEQEEFYYKVREFDRDINKFKSMTNIERAARTIFLNKACYNGLYRVNSKGQFNTPMGKYKNPSMYSKNNIQKLSKYFNKSDVIMMNGDYSEAIDKSKEFDIIYADPPYDYGNKEGFTNYQKEGFTFDDFKRLKGHLDDAIKRKSFVIISNNATERVIKLFDEDPNYLIFYDIKKINTNRTINSKGNLRKTGEEVIIMGVPVTFPQANSMEKIASLLRTNNRDVFNDKDKLKKFLNISTDRQIHYYLTALRFLKLIDAKNNYTDKSLELREYSRDKFKRELRLHILSFDPFKEVYEYESKNSNKLTTTEIAFMIKKHYPNYSFETYNRRASTVRKWVDWCTGNL